MVDEARRKLAATGQDQKSAATGDNEQASDATDPAAKAVDTVRKTKERCRK